MMNKDGRTILSEELLLKYGFKLTVQQIEDAQEGEIVNGCLVLKEKEYKNSQFQKRGDFEAVLALELAKVPYNLFHKAGNLKTVVMLEAEEIADRLYSGDTAESEQEDDKMENIEQIGAAVVGDDENFDSDQDEDIGAFTLTSVVQCFFPKLRRVGAFAFLKCPLTSLDEENFPVLQEVGNFGFYGCPIKQLNLPRLERVGEWGFCSTKISALNLPALKTIRRGGFSECSLRFAELPNLTSIDQEGFMDCTCLKWFSAENLDEIGENCFSKCSLLSRISCGLEPEKFTCSDEANYRCDGCPVCYRDVELCLQRGRSGEAERNVEIDEEAIDEVLNKFKVGIKARQALDADEGQIINQCLILKEELYQIQEYQKRSDFKSVLALRLRHVSDSMFYGAQNLTTIIAPNAVGVASSGFNGAGLQNCFFPKLTRAGDYGFQNCKIKQINVKNFPVLMSIGREGFSECPVFSVNLQSLLSIDDYGFSHCQDLKLFASENLQKVGKSCFFNCPRLQSINCNINPKKFTCRDPYDDYECGECAVCNGELLECLKRGKALGKLEKVKQIQKKIIRCLIGMKKCEQLSNQQICEVGQKFQTLQRKLIFVF